MKIFIRAGVVKLVNTHGSEPCASRLEGSSPFSGTKLWQAGALASGASGSNTIGVQISLPPLSRKMQARGSRFARRPNHKEFWAKKSVGDFAFWEKKIFNHLNYREFSQLSELIN